MKESDLRKWHRNLGIVLALFIILQTGSGLLITLSASGTPVSYAHNEPVVHAEAHEDGKPIWKTSISFLHHGAGVVGDVYRILLGIGMLGMALSGVMIFFKIRVRTGKGGSKSSGWKKVMIEHNGHYTFETALWQVMKV